MKLVHTGQHEWVFEDSVIDFPISKAPQGEKRSGLSDKVEDFINTQVQAGRDINDIMNDVMMTFHDEIIQDMDDQPPTAFQMIQMTLEHEGYEAARAMAQSLVLKNPHDPEAYFNLAFLCEEYNDSFLALLSSRECMRLYLSYFPQKFDWETDKISWGFMENRPFLRALFQLANLYADNHRFEQACEHGERLLQICPNDNLGIREALVEWYMATANYQKIIHITDSYPEDMLASVTFGKVLAYCYQDELKKAEQAWMMAQETLPEVAHEILKKRHPRPRGMHDEAYGMAIGGKEQAYYYWQDMGQWWEKNATAQALIEKKRAAKNKK